MDITSLKFALLGESGVGKTCLAIRFTEEVYDPTKAPTIQVDFLKKEINIEGRDVRLLVWDCAGQKKFEEMAEVYYKGSKSIFLVYDMSDLKTFGRVHHWEKEIKKNMSNDMPVIVVVGTKSDIKVESTEAKEFAESNGYLYFETSAKEDGESVRKVFTAAAQRALVREEENAKAKQNQAQGKGKGKSEKKKGGCVLL